MAWPVIRKPELNRLDVPTRLDRLAAQAATQPMKITPRKTWWLLRGYRRWLKWTPDLGPWIAEVKV
jgi:hypothetical protein